MKNKTLVKLWVICGLFTYILPFAFDFEDLSDSPDTEFVVLVIAWVISAFVLVPVTSIWAMVKLWKISD